MHEYHHQCTGASENGTILNIHLHPVSLYKESSHSFISCHQILFMAQGIYCLRPLSGRTQKQQSTFSDLSIYCRSQSMITCSIILLACYFCTEIWEYMQLCTRPFIANRFQFGYQNHSQQVAVIISVLATACNCRQTCCCLMKPWDPASCS